MSYVLGLTEQALVSLLNIGLNIWLIRIGGGELFGVYAFWFNVALLAGSVQYGLTLCHLAPLPPGPGTAAGRVDAEHALLAAGLALVGLALLLVAIAVAIDGGGGTVGVPAAIALVPCYLAYQYARALAFSRGALLAATLATAGTVVLIVGALAFDALTGRPASAGRALLIAAFGYGISGALTTWILSAGLRLRWIHLRNYWPYAAISRWSLLGIVCFELMNRAPGFAVTGWLGAGALGRMSTTQLPSRPPIIAVAGLLPAMRNRLADLRSQHRWTEFTRLTMRAGLAAAAFNAAWALPVGLAWPLLSRLAFNGRFAEDVGLGLLWTLSQAFGSVAAVVGTAFGVCGAFRRIGFADLAGAVATVIGLLVLLPSFGILGGIGATIAGQACYLAVVAAQWRFLREGFMALPSSRN